MPNPSEPFSIDDLREVRAAVAEGILTVAEARRLLGLPDQDLSPVEEYAYQKPGEPSVTFEMPRGQVRTCPWCAQPIMAGEAHACCDAGGTFRELTYA
jgi:hypothetical protein